MIYADVRGGQNPADQLKNKGFTIVELLVVIVVIAILAAISIVSYAAVTQNAKQQTTATDAQGMAAALLKYRAANGAYPANLSLVTSTPAVESTFQYTYNATADTYCLTASVKGASSYVVSGSSATTKGGCSGHGVNGNSPITNLAYNPSAEASFAGVSSYFSSPIATYPVTVSDAVSGTNIFQTTTNSDTNAQGLMHIAVSPAKANQTYTCSMSFRGTAGKVITFSGRYATAAGAHLSENWGQVSVTLSSSWQRAKITFTTTATTGIVRIQYKLTSAAKDVLIQSDALICTEGSTDYKFADGNTTKWVWNGTTNLSTSTGPAL